MAFVTETRTGGFSLFSRIADIRDAIAQRREQRKKYTTTLKELNHLTSRELADIGLTASDINRVALEASIR